MKTRGHHRGPFWGVPVDGTDAGGSFRPEYANGGRRPRCFQISGNVSAGPQSDVGRPPVLFLGTRFGPRKRYGLGGEGRMTSVAFVERRRRNGRTGGTPAGISVSPDAGCRARSGPTPLPKSDLSPDHVSSRVTYNLFRRCCHVYGGYVAFPFEYTAPPPPPSSLPYLRSRGLSDSANETSSSSGEREGGRRSGLEMGSDGSNDFSAKFKLPEIKFTKLFINGRFVDAVSGSSSFFRFIVSHRLPCLYTFPESNQISS